MSGAGRTAESVHAVEALMLEHFRTEPFHNLHLIYGPRLASAVPGGTCSDKTLSFVAASLRAGFDISLHSAFIGEREIHRLARVGIEDRQFFADVGNGWPALQLYPADRETSFRCFGMGFRTEIADGRLSVFHEKRGRESLQLEIDVCGRPESEIRADIEGRFSSGVVYPFSNSLRFSLVVGSRFLFLRGDRLEIYDDGGFECIEGIEDARVPEVLHGHFGFDVRALIRDDELGLRADRPLEGAKQSDEHVASADHGSAGESTTKDRSEGGGCRGQFS
jgi:arylamine N-acetyltransferase